MKLFKNLIPALVFAVTASAVSITAFAAEESSKYADDVSIFLDDTVEVTQPDENTSNSSAIDTDRVRNPPRYWPRPRPRPRYTCYAVNNRRQYFEGRANDRVTAAKRALENCAQYSRRCRFAGCQ